MIRTGSIQPGDIAYANTKGRLFHADVIGAGARSVLIVQPIQRNISYRQLTPSEIAEHCTHTPADRREARCGSEPYLSACAAPAVVPTVRSSCLDA